MSRLLYAGLCVAPLLLAQSANATVTTLYDSSLSSPNSVAADPTQTSTSNSSWYDGSGNPQGGFTVVQDSTTGIELGLRAKIRGSMAVYDSADSTYTFSTGAVSGRALWSYEFSINLRPDGSGGLTFADVISASLTVTDVGTGDVVTIDPLTHWPDDAGYGSVGGNTNAAKHTPQVAGDWSAQNSENLLFPDSPLAGAFDPWVADTYIFTLSIATEAGTTSDTITVNTVPEPATAGVLLAGVLGMVGTRRIRRG